MGMIYPLRLKDISFNKIDIFSFFDPFLLFFWTKIENWKFRIEWTNTQLTFAYYG